MRLLGNKERLKRLEEQLEKRLEERLKRLWVRIGENLKRLRWPSGRWWLAWASGAAITRYHTLRYRRRWLRVVREHELFVQLSTSTLHVDVHACIHIT